MTRIVLAIGLAIGAITAVLCCTISSSQAYGNAPWCAAVDNGGGDVTLNCQFQTFAQCQQSIVGGNRGFCNVNPDSPPSRTSPRQRNW
jgi:Protein of unknown function (DUF3551)